jgi:N-acyl-phosphatidylethanolamine-hydrolysing phospholipase D
MTEGTPAHHVGGDSGRRGFQNPWPNATLARFPGLLKWQFDRLAKPLLAQPQRSVFTTVKPTFPRPRVTADQVTMTWVGHASFLLQIGGLNILTDPMWSMRASPVSFAGPRRWVPPAVTFEDLPPIDAVLLTHNHYDHLDDATVRRLVRRAPEARWLAPLGLASFLRARGARRVLELDWWEETRLDAVAVGCAPAQHFSARGPFDRNRTLWCGWTLATAARQVYFAGDTGYHPEFARVADRFGPFHATLLPIGAYEPRWFMRPVHMNPEDAVQAFRDLRAGRPSVAGRRSVMVPMHWGTFRLTDEPMDEPPRRVARAWNDAGLAPEDLWILSHGETRLL